MTKQEYVQRYLEDILGDAWRKGGHKQGIDVTEEADKARLHLTKWGVVIKVKCPDCVWGQFGDEPVGMTPCRTCNSTGYIIEPLV